MKTIIYLEDGSVEATILADEHVAAGIARYATADEIAGYERNFSRDDARISSCRWCGDDPSECTLNECPEAVDEARD